MLKNGFISLQEVTPTCLFVYQHVCTRGSIGLEKVDNLSGFLFYFYGHTLNDFICLRTKKILGDHQISFLGFKYFYCDVHLNDIILKQISEW